MFNFDYGSGLLQINDLQRELSFRASDQASQLATRVQELEQQVQAAVSDLGSARQLAEERAAKIARLAVQQQPPPATDSAAEIAELRRQLEAAETVRLALLHFCSFVLLFLFDILIVLSAESGW